jgi:hypothetical protein
MKRLFGVLIFVGCLALAISGCGSDSDDAKAYVECGGQGTQSHCTIKCPGWDAQCDEDQDGRMMCECIEGPNLGFKFEQPDACTSDSFIAQEQCS